MTYNEAIKEQEKILSSTGLYHMLSICVFGKTDDEHVWCLSNNGERYGEPFVKNEHKSLHDYENGCDCKLCVTHRASVVHTMNNMDCDDDFNLDDIDY